MKFVNRTIILAASMVLAVSVLSGCSNKNVDIIGERKNNTEKTSESKEPTTQPTQIAPSPNQSPQTEQPRTESSDKDGAKDCSNGSCTPQSNIITTTSSPKAVQDSSIVINYNGVKVAAVVDYPKSKEVDVLLAFHGTAMFDSRIVEAAKTMLDNTKKIIKKDNVLIISVAYPEEGILFGDNIKQAEAALLWTKNNASKELGVKINKIYLFGHSQGGYLVTRLNTMHQTDGVIANGVGPIDLAIWCNLVETGKMADENGGNEKAGVCSLLKKEYGSVLDNPAPYTDRSLISFASGFKSRIIFVQGMQDKKIQMMQWPTFKQKVSQCTNCAPHRFLEVPGVGHGAVFQNDKAIQIVNNFLSSPSN